MKTKLTIIVLLFVAATCKVRAQFDTIPNHSFENWRPWTSGSYSGEIPIGWATSDSLTTSLGYGHTVIKNTDASVVCDANYSLQLVSILAVVLGVPGVATNGIIGGNITTPVYTGGTIDTARSKSLTGCYKYTPVNGDQGKITAILFRRNGSTGQRDTIAKTFFNMTSSTSSMIPFESNFEYLDFVNQPDSIFILIQTSPSISAATPVGTTLFIDNLLLNGFVGIDETIGILNSVNIFPSPASTELNIKIDLKKHLQTTAEIFDATGKNVLTHTLQSNNDKIDVRSLSNGNYFIDLRDENHNKIYSRKFSVNR